MNACVTYEEATMTNQDMFIAIDEDNLDLVSGGCFLPCVDPCKLVGDLVSGVEGLVDCVLSELPKLDLCASASLSLKLKGC